MTFNILIKFTTTSLLLGKYLFLISPKTKRGTKSLKKNYNNTANCKINTLTSNVYEECKIRTTKNFNLFLSAKFIKFEFNFA